MLFQNTRKKNVQYTSYLFDSKWHFFKKQLGFLNGNSTEHARMQLKDHINSSFEKNDITLGVSIDLSRVFDNVYHYILLTKLKSNGIKRHHNHITTICSAVNIELKGYH